MQLPTRVTSKMGIKLNNKQFKHTQTKMMEKDNRRIYPNIIFSILFIASILTTYFVAERGLDEVSQASLIMATEKSHGDMTLFSSNYLIEEFAALLSDYEEKKEEGINWSEFQNLEDYKTFDEKIFMLFENTDMLKLKLYASNGVTIYSTDPVQLGESKSELHNVINALRGSPSSQVSFRENFVGISRSLSNIVVVSSYHPLHDSREQGSIVGVVEMYSDINAEVNESQTNVESSLARLMLVHTSTFLIWIFFILFNNIRGRESDFK